MVLEQPGALFSQLWESVLAASLFVVTALVVYLPGRYLVVPATRRLLDALSVDDNIELPFLKVLDAVFAVFALFLAATVSGFASYLTATATITAAVALALGFAAQDLLGNFVSGVFIVLDPEFHIGDWVRWDGREGIVEDISFRVTRIHTFDNELITVPNSELTAAAIVSPAAKDRVRISVDFGISYEDDIDEARELLLAEAASTSEILDRPGPTVRLAELADSHVLLRVRFWVSQPARTDTLRIRSLYTQRVTERFDAEGVEMPFPTRELRGNVDVGSRATDGRGRPP
jgi:small-conductance mechanosensitive channel